MAAEHKALYDDPDDFGEKPVGVPGEIVFHHIDADLGDPDAIIQELEREGSKVGIAARAQHAIGKAVAVARGGASDLKLYVHDNPEVIIGAASVIATTVAGGIVFEKIVKPKIQERSRQRKIPQGY